MSKKPHIIIFNPDEMRWDTMGHMGNMAAITPNLDEFAKKDAVSFSHAYCQNPVCVPSRCSFFTGIYPHTRGHRTMTYLLRPGEDTLFSELRAAGYYVWMNSRNDLLAGQIPGWAESHADEIFYGIDKNPPGPENPDLRGERGNKYFYSHFEGRLGLDEDGKNYSEDDAVVDAAIERILNPPSDKPVCLFLGLTYPHAPYMVEEPYYSAIDRTKLPPRVKLEESRGKSRIIHKIHEYAAMDAFSEADWDELRAVYLGMCMKVDAQFGKLIGALEKAGIYDDCAIFFLSDHGDWAGDFGLPEKAQNTFEDCLTRVPLLIKPPKGVDFEPGISDAITELVDFYATTLDFAGLKSSHTHFGRSLRETLKNHDLAVREFACCEGGRLPEEIHCDEYHDSPGGAQESFVYWPKLMAQADNEAHAKGIMMRSKRYKFVSRINGEDELYDMEKDPQERINLINKPELAPVIAQMQKDMLRWMQETSDIVPFEHDDRFTREVMLAKVRKIVPPERMEALVALLDKGVPFYPAIGRVMAGE